MAASFKGHVDIVRMLIEAKAQVNTQNEVYMLLLPTEHTACFIYIYTYKYCTHRVVQHLFSSPVKMVTLKQ